MSRGTFVAVVGPSGAGKDSIIRGLAGAAPHVVAARRVITRPPDPTEDYLSVDEAAFGSMEAEGAFALTWRAHGLSYAIPASVEDDLARGRHVLANLSRSAIPAAVQCFDPVLTLSVTAARDALARRLAARGRETAADVSRRLDRADEGIPDDAPIVTVANDGPLDDAIAAALALLPQPVRA